MGERERERLSYKVWELWVEPLLRKTQKPSIQEWPKFTPFEGTNSSPVHVKVGPVCMLCSENFTQSAQEMTELCWCSVTKNFWLYFGSDSACPREGEGGRREL